MDNNQAVSLPGWYLPSDTAIGDALAFANDLRAVLLPLTSAQLQGATVLYDLGLTPGPPASLTSDSYSRLALYYSTSGVSGSILVPSPRQLVYDSSGPWRSFRYTVEQAVADGLVDDIEAIVTGTVFQTGEPFPNIFTVGALEEIVP